MPKVYDRIKKILEMYPEARDSDNVCEWIYLEQTGIVENGVITRSSFLSAPPLETVRRCRQKIQEYHPLLRASAQVESYRKEKEMTFPKWVFGNDGVARLV